MGGSIPSYNAAFTVIIIVGMGGVGDFSRPLDGSLPLMKRGDIPNIAGYLSFQVSIWTCYYEVLLLI